MDTRLCDVQDSNTCNFPSPDMNIPTCPFLCVKARKTRPSKGPFLSNTRMFREKALDKRWGLMWAKVTQWGHVFLGGGMLVRF